MKELNDNCIATLKDSLIKAVQEFLEEHPSFKMRGRSFVCPDSVIEKYVLKLDLLVPLVTLIL